MPTLSARRLLLAAGVFAATVVAAWFLRDLVRQYIVEPLADAGWFIWLGLISLHQAIYWGLLLFVGLLIALRSLGGRARPPAGPAYIETRQQYASRYQFWRANLIGLGHSPFAAERTARELQQVVLQVLCAPPARATADEIKARLASGELELPPAVAQLFAGRLNQLSFPPERPWWRRWFMRLPEPPPPIDVPAVLAWLEAQLSIPSEGASLGTEHS